MKFQKLLAATLATAFLAACGGGGSGSGTQTPTALSATQTNFEAAAIKDSYVVFGWNMPTTNVAPTPGTHFFYAVNVSATASPSTGPQTEINTVDNLSTTLALPILPNQYVARVLKSSVIYVANLPSKGEFSYVGNDVVITTYATDGLSKLFSSVYDSWSAPIALSGQIGSSAILKSNYWFARQTAQIVNFDFTQNWQAGSSYFTRKGYRQADTLFVYDWGNPTYDTNVVPVSATATTIEGLFASEPFASAGGITVDGVAHPLSDGSITFVEGARAWVATSKRSGSSTDTYAVLFELNGKVYFGNLEKAGTRFKYIDGMDNTIVNDYSIILNRTAGVSIKQAVKF